MNIGANGVINNYPKIDHFKKLIFRLTHFGIFKDDRVNKYSTLRFDKKIILHMHLNVVHQEKIEIKEESSICENPMDVDTGNPSFSQRVNNLELEAETNLYRDNIKYHDENQRSKETHIAEVHGKEKHLIVNFVIIAALERVI